MPAPHPGQHPLLPPPPALTLSLVLGRLSLLLRPPKAMPAITKAAAPCTQDGWTAPSISAGWAASGTTRDSKKMGSSLACWVPFNAGQRK